MRTVRVAITQPYVPAYRVPLWAGVIEALGSEGLEARVFFGGDAKQMAVRARRGDAVEVPWAEQVPTSTIRLGGQFPPLMYRQIPTGWRQSLLVTEMQATNGNAWAARVTNRPYITLGHGREYTSGSNSMAARLETTLNRGAAHALTYLPSGRDAVIERTRLPIERVTSFNNSTDTSALTAALNAVSPSDLETFRLAHGIPAGAPVALMLGALNSHKMIEFFVEAARQVLSEGQWWLVVAGDGELAPSLASLAVQTGRVTLLGQSGPKTFAPAAKLASVIVNPGRVGLVAVDALTMSLPVLTTSAARHAPEVEYLEEGNTLITVEPTAENYASAWRQIPAHVLRPAESPPSIEKAVDVIATRIREVAAAGETRR